MVIDFNAATLLLAALNGRVQSASVACTVTGPSARSQPKQDLDFTKFDLNTSPASLSLFVVPFSSFSLFSPHSQ